MSSKIIAKNSKIPLSKLVAISSKPYSSINVEYDKADKKTMSNYVLNENIQDVIEKFSTSMFDRNGSRAISITGPYGSGKSTMGLFLNGLCAGENSNEWKYSHDCLKTSFPKLAKKFIDERKSLKIHKHGFIRCVITARYESVTNTIVRALDIGVKEYFKNNTPNDFTISTTLQEMTKQINPDPRILLKIIRDLTKVAPILLLIDEFGKNIQYFTKDNIQGDLFLLQQIAEASTNTKKLPIFTMTFQHMAFEEYAIMTSAKGRKEWGKIQGRFEDIAFSNSPDQTRMLLSKSLHYNTTHVHDIKLWANNHFKNLRQIGLDEGISKDNVLSCYPLHPLSVIVLPELCARYGQYERSLNSFIFGGHDSVTQFIENKTWFDGKQLPVLGLDILYDFFVSTSSLIHSASSNLSRIVEIETIIRDSHGLTSLEIKTLKIIGILNLLSTTGTLRASKYMIDYAMGMNSSTILQKLQERSVITFREYANEYRIWHGTDVNIRMLLEHTRSRYVNTNSLSHILKNIFPLEPIIASRHSIETGTMRIFTRHFSEEIPSNFDAFEKYDGHIIYLTVSKENKSKIDKFTTSKPIIIVKPNDLTDLRDMAIEMIAIKDILDSEQSVASDYVSKHELEEMLAHTRSKMQQIFDTTYGENAVWEYVDGIKRERMSGKIYSIVSDVAYKKYKKTPKTSNEMINKNTLTSQGIAARTILLNSMITNSHMPLLGIEGWGPERAMYEAVINKTGMHSMGRGDMNLQLQKPKEKSLAHMWDIIFDGIKERKNKRVNVNDLYKILKAPPIGAKDGLISVIIVALLVTHKKDIALYEHGNFCRELLPEISERMVKNPIHFELKYVKTTSKQKVLVDTIASKMKITKSCPTILDVVIQLVKTVSIIPPYVKKTDNLNLRTKAVRDAILDAREPDSLLFVALPDALKISIEKEPKKFANILAKEMLIIANEFEHVLKNTHDKLLNEIGMDNRENLSKIVLKIVEHVTDPDMKKFLNAVKTNTFDKNADWIKYIAMVLTNSPPSDWTDDDRKNFDININTMSKQFKRLTALYFNDITNDDKSCRVIVTYGNGHEYDNVVSVNDKYKKDANTIILKAVKEIQRVSKNNKSKTIMESIALLAEMQETTIHHI